MFQLRLGMIDAVCLNKFDIHMAESYVKLTRWLK